MRLHKVLGLDGNANLLIPEDSYSSLKDLYRSLGFLERIARAPTEETVRAARDPYGHVACLAVLNPETAYHPAFWAVFCGQVARCGIPSPAAERFDHLAGTILAEVPDVTWSETTDAELGSALREYFSLALVERQLCEGCVKPSETYQMVYLDSRVQRLDLLFQKLGSRFVISERVLEICCGNGMATISLDKVGIKPLTTDYDRCQICQGLEHGVLKPENTMVMDATRLSYFFPEDSFDTVMGFMLGTIYGFNKDVWISMMAESLNVLRPGGQLLFTVNRREEMDILHDALKRLGAVGEVIDNTDTNGIYDQWVYLGEKQS